MITLDVVIVNWNAGKQLLECLESISTSWQRSVFELIQCVVVDNASIDESANILTDFPFPLTVIKNRENKGFGSASNQGAVAGNGQYILFLNPDVRLFKDSLTKALLCLEEPQNKQIGILGIQLVDEKGLVYRNSGRFPTLGSFFYQMLGLDVLCPSRFPPHIMEDWDHQDNREVDRVEGAFCLMRRDVFEELQGFDETFFMYFEDVDFAYRARQAGWKSYYLAEAQAFHRGGGTTHRIIGRRLSYWFRSRLQYAAKHFGLTASRKILMASLSVEFLTRVGFNMIKLDGKHLIETFQAYRMYVQALPELLENMEGKKESPASP